MQQQWERHLVLTEDAVTRGLVYNFSCAPRDDPTILDVHLHQCFLSALALPLNCIAVLRHLRAQLAGEKQSGEPRKD